jgi:hypothetical protein
MEIEYVFEPSNQESLSSDFSKSSSTTQESSPKQELSIESINLLRPDSETVSKERVKSLDDDEQVRMVECKVGSEGKLFQVNYEHCMNSNMLKAMLEYDLTSTDDPISFPLMEPIDFELIIEYWDIISYTKTDVLENQVNTSVQLWLQRMDVPRLTSLLLTASYLVELSLMDLVCVHLKTLYQKGKNVAEYCALLKMRVPSQEEFTRLFTTYAPRFGINISQKEPSEKLKEESQTKTKNTSPNNSKKRSANNVTDTTKTKKSRK